MKKDRKSKPISREQMWKDFEALYGAWADRDDIGDDWLDNLRASWDDSFNALYKDDLDDETKSEE